MRLDSKEFSMRPCAHSIPRLEFQPVITGEMIMETFGISPSKEVGLIKVAVREAILEGQIENTIESGMPFVLEEGRKLGLTPAL